MSLINDALKQARKSSPPPGSPPVMPGRAPLPPVKDDDEPTNVWVVLGVIVGIIFVITLVATWMFARHEDRTVETSGAPAEDVIQIAPISRQSITLPAPTATTEVSDVPTLQGIFYSPTAPMAIIGGKTVHVGDHVGAFRVQEIAKTTATLIGPDGKATKLTMSN
jgi:hypothetical protein